LTILGNTAVINSITPIDLEQSQQPNQALPQIPLALPSLGGTPANVLLDLTLSNIGVDVSGTLTSVANGVLVPAPAAMSLLGVAGLCVQRRRRGSTNVLAN
jgi:hypothetical protein